MSQPSEDQNSYNAPGINYQDRDQMIAQGEGEYTLSNPAGQQISPEAQIAFLATHEEPSPEHIERLKSELVKRSVDVDILKARARKDPSDPADTQAEQEPLPDMFQSLRTVILARDCADEMKISAAKALLNVAKTGTERASAFASNLIIELLTHERLRGR